MRKAQARAGRNDGRKACEYSIEDLKKKASTTPRAAGRKRVAGVSGNKSLSAEYPRTWPCGSRRQSMGTAAGRLGVRMNTIVELRKTKAPSPRSQSGISSFRRF